MICPQCGKELEPILGAPISAYGIYHEVVGYRCPDHGRLKLDRETNEWVLA